MARFVFFLTFVLLLFISLPARANGDIGIDYAEFVNLARDLAPKVALFRDAWDKEPSAVFHGGTTRDFLFWIKRQLNSGATSQSLRHREVIDARELFTEESDVDIIAKKDLELQPTIYGVRKIDYGTADSYDLTTSTGRDELRQGFLPVEKIRLGKSGLILTPELGNGVQEIYDGRITARFNTSATFWTTARAKEKLNHPVLLALRYLRCVGVNYFAEHGGTFPDLEALFDLDPKSASEARAILQDAVRDRGLTPFLSQRRFKSWIDAVIRKSFLSHTNPTAAKALFDSFGVPTLLAAYPEIGPYQQLLFAKRRNPKEVKQWLERIGITAQQIFVPIESLIPDRKLFHGTKQQDAFRSIFFQGILPSDTGTAGGGLYGVAHENIDFAIDWAGERSRVVGFTVDKNARVVDISEGEGKRAFKKFSEIYTGPPGGVEDGFAEALGIDILRYPYRKKAFVVKNSEVLSRPIGLEMTPMSLPQLIEKARSLKTEDAFDDFVRTLDFNGVGFREFYYILEAMAHNDANESFRSLARHLIDVGEGRKPFSGDVSRAVRFLPFLLGRNVDSDKRIVSTVLLKAPLEVLRSAELFASLYARAPKVLLGEIVPQLVSRYSSLANLRRNLGNDEFLYILAAFHQLKNLEDYHQTFLWPPSRDSLEFLFAGLEAGLETQEWAFPVAANLAWSAKNARTPGSWDAEMLSHLKAKALANLQDHSTERQNVRFSATLLLQGLHAVLHVPIVGDDILPLLNEIDGTRGDTNNGNAFNLLLDLPTSDVAKFFASDRGTEYLVHYASHSLGDGSIERLLIRTALEVDFTSPEALRIIAAVAPIRNPEAQPLLTNLLHEFYARYPQAKAQLSAEGLHWINGEEPDCKAALKSI